MRSVLVAVVLVGASSVAHAEERNTVLSVGGMAGGVGDFAAPGGPDQAWGTRISLAWERPLIEMPTARGYKIRGALVPELVVGGLVLDEQQRADGYLGAGLRAELQFSQREMGLMRISARGAGYLAVRGIVVGEDRQGLFEFGIGEYFARHRSSTRIGYEIDVLFSPGERPMDDTVGESTVGLMMNLYVGGAL